MMKEGMEVGSEGTAPHIIGVRGQGTRYQQQRSLYEDLSGESGFGQRVLLHKATTISIQGTAND